MTELIKMNKTNREEREKNRIVRNRKTGMYEQSLKCQRNSHVPRTGSASNRKMDYIHGIHHRDEPTEEELLNLTRTKEESANQELKWLINSRYKAGIMSRISRLSQQNKQNQMEV